MQDEQCSLQPVTSLSDDDAEAATLPEVDCLSDDQQVDAKNQAVPISHPSKTSKRKRTAEAKIDVSKLTKRLQAVTSSKCKCKNPHCRHGFKTASGFERLVQYRLHLMTLEKPQQDSEASCLLKKLGCVVVCFVVCRFFLLIRLFQFLFMLIWLMKGQVD